LSKIPAECWVIGQAGGAFPCQAGFFVPKQEKIKDDRVRPNKVDNF
jgi:hypothetical protein